MSTKEEGFDAALAIVNAWIANMERAPRMWGGPEALELQMIQLVEVRQKLLRPRALEANPYETVLLNSEQTRVQALAEST